MAIKTNQPKGDSVPLPDRWESFALIRKSWTPVPKSIRLHFNGPGSGRSLAEFRKTKLLRSSRRWVIRSAVFEFGPPFVISKLSWPAGSNHINFCYASFTFSPRPTEELLGQIWSWSCGRRFQEEALLLWRGNGKHRWKTRYKFLGEFFFLQIAVLLGFINKKWIINEFL